MIGHHEQPGDVYQGLLFREPNGNHEELIFSHRLSSLTPEQLKAIQLQQAAKSEAATAMRAIRALKSDLNDNINDIRAAEDVPGAHHQKVVDLMETHLADMHVLTANIRDKSLAANGLLVAIPGEDTPLRINCCDYDVAYDSLLGQPQAIRFQPEQIIIEWFRPT